jgi:hypothetical protein
MSALKKYWYKIDRYVCVLCGHVDEYRERVYGDRPNDYQSKTIDTACTVHFV